MPSLNFGEAWPWLQWIIAAMAIIGFIGGAIRVIPSAWRVVSRMVTTINALSDLPDELKLQAEFRDETKTRFDEQDKQISEIHHEVHYNNGSSVKDATKRIETGVEGLYKQIEELKDSDISQSSRIDDIESFLPPRDGRGRFMKKDDSES